LFYFLPSNRGDDDVIHIVNAENRSLYERELDQHHQLRHQYFYEDRGWTDLESRDGREYDPYDNASATYALAIEEDDVVGAARLYPTLRPHMLEEVCPQLAEVRGVPRGTNVYEWTRLFIVKSRREGRYGGDLVAQLFCGCFEHCLEEGIGDLSLVCEAWWLPRLQQLGWKISPLGLPGLIDNQWWVASVITVSQAALATTRAAYGISGSVMVRNGMNSRRLVA
jgi:acyl-homoserine lactone synthase